MPSNAPMSGTSQFLGILNRFLLKPTLGACSLAEFSLRFGPVKTTLAQFVEQFDVHPNLIIGCGTVIEAPGWGT
jgi:hypothetical protein